ncbi:RNase P modulator RnpM [Johnsonella ignava]|uniref:RNase P modulator RnpM n=1 Tax=Johnsonella ignava TaxID=43995 RepID=UPI002FE6E8B9
MIKKKQPQRLCIGCGIQKDKKEMVRIVRTEDIQIIIDETGKKNGRGAYICKNAECMKKALKSRGLDRSFKIPVSKEVYENLALQMEDLYG